jgi:hypothetical protein
MAQTAPSVSSFRPTRKGVPPSLGPVSSLRNKTGRQLTCRFSLPRRHRHRVQRDDAEKGEEWDHTIMQSAPAEPALYRHSL